MPSSTHWGDPIPSPGSPPATGAALVWDGSTWAADATTYRKTATLIVNADVDAAAAIVPTKFSQAAWATYVPALTASVSNPTLGSGSTATGRYSRQADRTIHIQLVISFGTSGTNAGSGNYQVSIPVNQAAQTATEVNGNGYLYDSSANALYVVVVTDDPNSDARVTIWTDQLGQVTDAVPFAWAVSDSIALNLTYEAVS